MGRSQPGYLALVTTPDDRRHVIDHAGDVLLWRQVADDLEARIKAGELPPGSKLRGELDLAEDYGVSRVTVRRAALELRKQGLLRVVTGKGTFVPRQV